MAQAGHIGIVVGHAGVFVDRSASAFKSVCEPCTGLDIPCDRGPWKDLQTRWKRIAGKFLEKILMLMCMKNPPELALTARMKLGSDVEYQDYDVPEFLRNRVIKLARAVKAGLHSHGVAIQRADLAVEITSEEGKTVLRSVDGLLVAPQPAGYAAQL